MTRRVALAMPGLAVFGGGLFGPRGARGQTAPEAAGGAAQAWRHGLSVFGDLKYAADFSHFDYVNPDAPKGGTLSLTPSSVLYNQGFNTFNTLNIHILQGDGAQGMELTFDSLMTAAADEPDSLYGLVAEAVRVSEDGNLYRFRLREAARFHDGSALTAEDAAFSLNLLKEEGHPLITQTIGEMEGAEAEDERVLAVRFSGRHARDVPLTVAGLPIFSRAYYAERDFTGSTMQAPLGSGPYRVGDVRPGRAITLERVADYWAGDLPVHRGRWNFDRIRYEYFRDRDIAFEAFKSGAYRLREEFTSATWARGYDFPAARDGRVTRDTLPDDTPSGAQGWFINTRRAKFADPRVREALILAFDFEWTNENLMFGSYERSVSFFQNSELMAEGPPGEAERAILEPHREALSEDVFGEPFVPPKTDGTGRNREQIRRATELLEEAGWSVREERDPEREVSFWQSALIAVGLGAAPTRRMLRNGNGEAFRIEFLDFDPGLEPHTQAYIRNLARLGIQAGIRRVDAAQYQSRLNDFNFDMTVRRYSMSPTPGESLALVFGSRAAETPGSRNLSGIKDPVIDDLVARAIAAETREDLTSAVRALDRVVRAGRYWVPHWYKGEHWMAYWDEFARPPEKPRYARGVLDTWWHTGERIEADEAEGGPSGSGGGDDGAAGADADGRES